MPIRLLLAASSIVLLGVVTVVLKKQENHYQEQQAVWDNTHAAMTRVQKLLIEAGQKNNAPIGNEFALDRISSNDAAPVRNGDARFAAQADQATQNSCMATCTFALNHRIKKAQQDCHVMAQRENVDDRQQTEDVCLRAVFDSLSDDDAAAYGRCEKMCRQP